MPSDTWAPGWTQQRRPKGPAAGGGPTGDAFTPRNAAGGGEGMALRASEHRALPSKGAPLTASKGAHNPRGLQRRAEEQHVSPHAVEYYSAVKGDGVLTRATTSTNLTHTSSEQATRKRTKSVRFHSTKYPHR